jgi:hypothetical protein
MVDLHKPIMFVGGAGVGKTQLVKGKLASLPEEMMSLSISFNYFTDVISFQKVGGAQRNFCCLSFGLGFFEGSRATAWGAAHWVSAQTVLLAQGHPGMNAAGARIPAGEEGRHQLWAPWHEVPHLLCGRPEHAQAGRL